MRAVSNAGDFWDPTQEHQPELVSPLSHQDSRQRLFLSGDTQEELSIPLDSVPAAATVELEAGIDQVLGKTIGAGHGEMIGPCGRR